MRTIDTEAKKAEAGHTIERLKKVFVVGTDMDLANKLGVAKTTLSSWRQRGVPYAICVRTARDKRIRIEWLVSGEGMMVEPTREGIGISAEQAEAFRMANDIVTDAMRLVGYTPDVSWILLMQELAVRHNLGIEGIKRIVQTLAAERQRNNMSRRREE